MTRTLFSLVTCAALISIAGVSGGCDSDSGDTTADTAGDGDTAGTTGDGDESGSSGNSGDGDGDGDGDSGTDPDCPAGSFDCPCNDGVCEAGLSCGPDGLCALGGETGNPTTGDPTTTTTTTSTTGGEADPYDPETCEAPSKVLGVEMVDGEFCSAPCVDSEECPAGSAGTTAACAIATEGAVPNFCTLICTPDSEDCPMGSTCKVIPMQPNTGLCTYP